MIVFDPARPKSFTRRELADIMTALSVTMPEGGYYGAGYQAALLAVGLAMGMTAQQNANAVEIVEVTK